MKASFKCALAILMLAVLALPTPAIVGFATHPKVHIYSDGGVSIEFTYTKEYSGKPLGLDKARLAGMLEVAEGYYEASANASLEFGSTPPSHYVYAELSANATGLNYNSTVWLELRVWDEKGELTATLNPLVCRLNASRLVVELYGCLEAYAVGEAKEVIAGLAALNKSMVEEFLAWAGLTWIAVKDLNETVSEDSARLEFKAEADYAKLAEICHANLTQVRELFKPIPQTSFGVHLRYNTTNLCADADLKVRGDVNEDLAKTVQAMKLQSALTRLQEGAGGSLYPAIPSAILQPLAEVAGDFAEGFSIIKSTGKVSIELKDGSLTVSVATPKMVKKGSTLPSDTLLAVYDIAVEAKEKLKAEKLLNATVELVPHGVRVRRGGVEVQESRLWELNELKATIITSINISADRTKATAGESVTLKGSIAPAISAPITLIVKEPDGAVRRLNTTSGSDGAFALTVRLDKAGNYSFAAEFQGNDAYEASKSYEAYVEATSAPPQPWLYAAIAVVVITVAAAATLLLRKRKAAKT